MSHYATLQYRHCFRVSPRASASCENSMRPAESLTIECGITWVTQLAAKLILLPPMLQWGYHWIYIYIYLCVCMCVYVCVCVCVFACEGDIVSQQCDIQNRYVSL